ncbi:MAG TPA: hypothetical protein VLH19_00320 [Patescibacteria group bacterium]|nr:hypothetical protein [Patescibacteria group bacterium]
MFENIGGQLDKWIRESMRREDKSGIAFGDHVQFRDSHIAEKYGFTAGQTLIAGGTDVSVGSDLSITILDGDHYYNKVPARLLEKTKDPAESRH